MKNLFRSWIKDKLRQIRKSLNLSHKEMAEKLGLKTGTYQSYEEGRACPSIFTLKKVCALSNITLDAFMQDCPN